MGYQKLAAILVAALFALALVGCSSSSNSSSSSSVVSSALSSSEPATSSSVISSTSADDAPAFDPVTIVDDDKVTIRVDAFGSDPNYRENYGFVCYLENKTDNKLTFVYEDGSFSVDGAMTRPKFKHDVMPGKHDNKAYLVFLAEDGVTSYDQLKDVEGVIELRGPDSYELIDSYPFAVSCDPNATSSSNSSSSAVSASTESVQSSEASTSAAASSSSAASTNTSTNSNTGTGAGATTGTGTSTTQNRSKEVKDENLQGTLLANAQTVVKDHLKSPSSAKFPWGFDEYKFLDKGSSSKHPGYTTYSIEGPVEAQNTYGAQIKGKFKVVIDYSDREGTYYEVSCDIS